MTIPSEHMIPYLAGLLDGEGSVTLTKAGGSFRTPQVIVASNDVEILDAFADHVGGMRPYLKRAATDKHRAQWQWSCKGTRAMRLLSELLPYLRIPKKKARAQLIVDRYAEVTKRNGNYNPEQRALKERFEEDFWHLS